MTNGASSSIPSSPVAPPCRVSDLGSNPRLAVLILLVPEQLQILCVRVPKDNCNCSTCPNPLNCISVMEGRENLGRAWGPLALRCFRVYGFRV